MEVPAGQSGGTPTAVAAVRHLRLGQRLIFKGACTSLTLHVQALPPDGEPIRADVKLTLKQAERSRAKGQNPTTRAQAGFGMHTVKDGDTLPSISYGAYGDATQLAADRRGQRRRQPAAPAPRQLAVAADAGELMPRGRKPEQHVAGIDVLVDGAKLDPKWRDLTLEVKVVDSLTLPDMALVRIADPKGENIDSHPLQLGKDIEIKAVGDGRPRDDVDLQGPDRRRRARVHGQGLRRSRSAPTTRRTSSTASARRARSSRCRPRTWSARSPARPASRPEVESTSVVHEFFQQSNETDWDFALAARADARLRGRRRRTRRSTSARPTRPRAPRSR